MPAPRQPKKRSKADPSSRSSTRAKAVKTIVAAQPATEQRADSHAAPSPAPVGAQSPADSPLDALDPKERTFAQAYVRLRGDGPAAAREAGYSDGPGLYVTVHRLLRRDKVRAAIAALQLAQDAQNAAASALAAERHDVTAEWVLDELRDNAVRAKRLLDFPASNKALELLGKHVGLWRDPAKLTPEERRAMIADILSAAKERQRKGLQVALSPDASPDVRVARSVAHPSGPRFVQ